MKGSSKYYLSNDNRLADVIAAIQAMSTYKYYKMDFAGWADRISGDSTKGHYWELIFQQHPEFFRLDSGREKASLVWRRQHPKRYHVGLLRKLTNEEYDELPNDIKLQRVSREPLKSDEIQALIETAINLHTKEVELRQERRWWIPILSIIAGLVGALIGGILKG
jgi:hypothetical protein